MRGWTFNQASRCDTNLVYYIYIYINYNFTFSCTTCKCKYASANQATNSIAQAFWISGICHQVSSSYSKPTNLSGKHLSKILCTCLYLQPKFPLWRDSVLSEGVFSWIFQQCRHLQQSTALVQCGKRICMFQQHFWVITKKSANQKLRPAAIIDSDITLSPEMYHHGIHRILWILSSYLSQLSFQNERPRTVPHIPAGQIKWQNRNMLHWARQWICDVRGMIVGKHGRA